MIHSLCNNGEKRYGPDRSIRRDGKNTQKNYTKKVLMIQITTMVWSSPDILECEVKWALESITKNKASGGDGIPVWCISNPKRWCCESAALNMPVIWKTQQSPQDWKRSVFIPIPKKGNAKECLNYLTIALISHASKVMLKILQARLQ